jgi:hypothetical protein
MAGTDWWQTVLDELTTPTLTGLAEVLEGEDHLNVYDYVMRMGYMSQAAKIELAKRQGQT